MQYHILLITFLLFNWNYTNAQSDYELVEQTVNYYLDGGTNADFETLKKAFHKTATMKFVGDEGYKEVNALAFFGNAMKAGGKKSIRKTYVSQINVCGTAASARLEMLTPDFLMVDYMNMLKIDGEWKIVSKIFNGRSIEQIFAEN